MTELECFMRFRRDAKLHDPLTLILKSAYLIAVFHDIHYPL